MSLEVPFSFSNAPAVARPARASRGREVRTTEAVIVRGRSGSWSSSGIGVVSAAERFGGGGEDIMCGKGEGRQ